MYSVITTFATCKVLASSDQCQCDSVVIDRANILNCFYYIYAPVVLL